MQYWQTSRRQIPLARPLVMGILNVTPDSFSDGGKYVSIDAALRHAEEMIADGADIIDIGGESTRPGSRRITIDEEKRRTAPVIDVLSKRFDIAISVDTSKSEVARVSVDAGAEIINDIAGLRWDERIADIAAETGAGLVLMHSRGSFETMHGQEPVDDILVEVGRGLRRSVQTAKSHGVRDEQIALDIGIGFGKTLEQNLELLANLGRITSEFETYPMFAGTSRKSFIGKILGDVPPAERLAGSLATALFALSNGANIVRVHDVRETVSAIRVLRKIGGSAEIRPMDRP